MSKQDAIELFNKGNLVESETIFQQEVAHSEDDLEKIECLEYILHIHRKLNKASFLETQVKLYDLYSKKNLNDKVINLYPQIKRKTFIIKKKYLEALWDVKNIADFDRAAQLISEDVLAKRVYVHGRDFFLWLKSIRKWMLYPRLSLVLIYLDLGSEKEALVELCEFEELICSKWSKVERKKKTQKDYLKHIADILREREFHGAQLAAYKSLLEVKLFLLEVRLKVISKKEILGLMIFYSQSPKELSLFIPFIKNEENKKEFIRYIKSFGEKGLFAIESPFYFLMEDLKERKNINIVKNNNKEFYPAHYHVEKTDEEYDPSIFEKYLKNEKDLDVEKTELFFKGLIRYESPEVKEEKENLVVAFLELGLYESAKFLLSKEENSINKSYLQCEVLFKEQAYTEVIAVANEALNEFYLNEQDQIPFYYLKAHAYQKLNKEVEAQNIFSLINTYNPNFRSLKEKLLDD